MTQPLPITILYPLQNLTFLKTTVPSPIFTWYFSMACSPFLQASQEFLRWSYVADTIEGMIVMEQWFAPEEQPLPTEGEQITLLAESQAEKENTFVFPQAAIDYILASGSGVENGKYRIYEHFQLGETAEENVRFLKNEYGKYLLSLVK